MSKARKDLVWAVGRKDGDSLYAAVELCRLLRPKTVKALIGACYPDGITPSTFDLIADAFAIYTTDSADIPVMEAA